MFKKVLKGAGSTLQSRMDSDPYIAVVEKQCDTCERFIRSKLTCEAFPEGIPTAILFGQDHRSPYMEMGVVLDRGLRYEPKEDHLTNDMPSDSIETVDNS